MLRKKTCENFINIIIQQFWGGKHNFIFENYDSNSCTNYTYFCDEMNRRFKNF